MSFLKWHHAGGILSIKAISSRLSSASMLSGMNFPSCPLWAVCIVQVIFRPRFVFVQQSCLSKPSSLVVQYSQFRHCPFSNILLPLRSFHVISPPADFVNPIGCRVGTVRTGDSIFHGLQKSPMFFSIQEGKTISRNDSGCHSCGWYQLISFTTIFV